MLVSSVQAVKSTIIFVSRLGPAESLFQESYYELMKKALKPDGVLCCQGKCNIFICKIDAMYAATDQKRAIVSIFMQLVNVNLWYGAIKLRNPVETIV